jgi:CRISPR-associated protein Cas1
MSHHILHVFQHGSLLGRERGFILCRAQDESERRLPLDDIRAVIIAARGVTLTSSFLSGMLETDAIVLHCDERYQPCGWTAPLARVVDLQAFEHQMAKPRRLNERLWREMIRTKTLNQSRVLQHKSLRSPHLELALKTNEIDEANCARRYWQLYFPSIGWTATKRDRKEDTAPNQMLNYGYAVLAALCHRSLIIHGLLPQLGVFHKPRYRSDPLVYDLMEGFRPAVELMLAGFMLGEDVTMKAWAKKVGTELRESRVKHGQYTLKLMDAIDASANSLARSYAELSSIPFWLPELPEAPRDSVAAGVSRL